MTRGYVTYGDQETNWRKRRFANNPLTLVAGPPCAGKNHWVDAHRNPGDLVLDSDALYAALAREGKPENLRQFVWKAFWSVLAETRSEQVCAHTWVIQCAPEPARRDDYRQMNNAQVVVLATPAEVCKSRALDRYGDRTDPLCVETCGWIDEWWANYRPSFYAEEVVEDYGF